MAEAERSRIFSRGKIGSLELRNRIIRAGCFEGMCQEGRVTAELIEHHRMVAKGGVGMTTVGCCAITFDGRGFSDRLWLRDEILPDLTRLTDAVHREGAAVSIQLLHSGFFSSRKVIGKTPLGASAKFCMYQMSRCREMGEQDINAVVEGFGKAAAMAKHAGFDAVEIHAGHGYLISQFLSPWTNHRKDSYGGSLENRLRFPAAIIKRVRAAVGQEFPILVKMNQRDGMKGGLELDEAIEIAKRFEVEGASALVPSCGFTAKTPLYMMRGNVPTMEMAKNESNPLVRLGLVLFGRLTVQTYTFEPMFLLSGARRIKDAVKIPVVYLGGALSLDRMESVIKEGFQFIEIGRAMVRDPHFVRKLERGEIRESDCDHCNRCIATMDAGGLYCVSTVKGLLTR